MDVDYVIEACRDMGRSVEYNKCADELDEAIAQFKGMLNPEQQKHFIQLEALFTLESALNAQDTINYICANHKRFFS
jgi:hypothetical protein